MHVMTLECRLQLPKQHMNDGLHPHCALQTIQLHALYRYIRFLHHMRSTMQHIPIQRFTTHLEGVELFPRKAPGHHFPHDYAKRVHISSFAVVMILHHLQRAVGTVGMSVSRIRYTCFFCVFYKIYTIQLYRMLGACAGSPGGGAGLMSLPISMKKCRGECLTG